MVKIPEPIKTPALVTRITKELQLKAKRKQLLDVAARKAAAEVARVKPAIGILTDNEPGGRCTIADLNADMTFSRCAARYGHTDYMKSRRVG
jgi:hypothetical protein